MRPDGLIVAVYYFNDRTRPERYIAATIWRPETLSARAEALGDAVTIGDDPSAFTLSNGIVTAHVSKRSGDLTSLQFKGAETLNDRSGHAGGYWSHDTTGGKQTVTRVTIDPKSNGGERGEVSVTGISGGVKMGHGPGAARGGDFPADIEIRYSLGRDDSGVYTYCAFEHKAELSGGVDDRGPLLRQARRHLRLDDHRRQAQPVLPGRPPRGRQVYLHGRAIRPPRLRMVEHREGPRLLAHQPEPRVSQRRSDQSRVPLPSRHDAGRRRVRTQLLAKQPLRRGSPSRSAKASTGPRSSVHSSSTSTPAATRRHSGKTSAATSPAASASTSPEAAAKPARAMASAALK